MADLRDWAAEVAPDAVEWVDLMAVGSAERMYSQRYLAHCLVGGIEHEGVDRPGAREYGLGVQHATDLREAIDERLPKEKAKKPAVDFAEGDPSEGFEVGELVEVVGGPHDQRRGEFVGVADSEADEDWLVRFEGAAADDAPVNVRFIKRVDDA